MRKSKKSATPLQHWVAWKIASRAKELGVVTLGAGGAGGSLQAI